MADIAELDETAQRLKVSWRKANNYYASFATQLLEIRRQIEAGAYGPEWTFSGWLLKKAGLFESQVMTQLKVFSRVIAAEERAKIEQANIEIAVQKRTEKRAFAAAKAKTAEEHRRARAIAKAHKDRELEMLRVENEAKKQDEQAERQRQAEAKKAQEIAQRQAKQRQNKTAHQATMRMQRKQALFVAPPENEELARRLDNCARIKESCRFDLGREFVAMKEIVDTHQAGRNPKYEYWTWTGWCKIYVNRSRSSIAQCIAEYINSTLNVQALDIEQRDTVVQFPKISA